VDAACRRFAGVRRPDVDAGSPPGHRDAVEKPSCRSLRNSPLARAVSRKAVMLTFILWCLLFVFCWPLALLALVLYPIVWLLTLPFRVVGISVAAVFALLTALLFLPARVLGQRR
jgi:hypothetical protein